MALRCSSKHACAVGMNGLEQLHQDSQSPSFGDVSRHVNENARYRLTYMRVIVLPVISTHSLYSTLRALLPYTPPHLQPHMIVIILHEYALHRCGSPDPCSRIINMRYRESLHRSGSDGVGASAITFHGWRAGAATTLATRASCFERMLTQRHVLCHAISGRSYT